ncbi:MAG: flavodoxin reductase [Bacteroidetes bacterium]|nr:flavodoxin reductase [Bacteroidota bacterium]
MSTEAHIVKILNISQVTHDVKCFRLEKPEGYHFTPGQATEVSVNMDGWRDEKRPFTFTSLNNDPYLEFTIKGYPGHHGVTEKIHSLNEGDELIIRDVWGAIAYKGPGYFIAGGAGITPFIAILRQLYDENKLEGNTLFFSNKTESDIIYRDELKAMLGDDAVFMITEEETMLYEQARIDEEFLKTHVDDFNKHFYVCGPDKMISDINEVLSRLHAKADNVVFEK